MVEDILSEIYYPIIALNMLAELFLYQANEDWNLFSRNISRKSSDEIYATMLLMKLIIDRLWKIRKIYYWKMCKSDY